MVFSCKDSGAGLFPRDTGLSLLDTGRFPCDRRLAPRGVGRSPRGTSGSPRGTGGSPCDLLLATRIIRLAVDCYMLDILLFRAFC